MKTTFLALFAAILTMSPLSSCVGPHGQPTSNNRHSHPHQGYNHHHRSGSLGGYRGGGAGGGFGGNFGGF